MKKITLLLILLLAGRLHAQTGLYFPKKINRVVIGYDFDTVRNQRVIIEAVYYKRVGYKELFSETYRVTTDKNGMAAIVRGTGYKRTGNYKDVEKLLLEDDNAAIQLIHMRDDDREIADLGKIYPSGKLKQKPERSKPALKEPEEVINVWEETPAQTPPTTRNVTAVTAREDRPIPDTANDILSFRNWYFMRYDAKDPEKPITDTAPRTGYFERAASGLKLYANAVQDNWIKAREPMDFTGRTVYMKWKTETNGHMCDMRWNLYDSTEYNSNPFMTPHSIGIISMNWQIDMSTTVNYKNLQWLYTRFAFDNKKDVVVTTATGNYDDKGGKLVSRQRYLCPTLTGYFGWRLHDAHESNSSWVIVNQLVIK